MIAKRELNSLYNAKWRNYHSHTVTLTLIGPCQVSICPSCLHILQLIKPQLYKNGPFHFKSHFSGMTTKYPETIITGMLKILKVHIY